MRDGVAPAAVAHLGASAGTGSRLPGLDALRGLAIALVLLNHADPVTFGAAGILGVTLFFTLSGYLITGILVRDIERHGRVRYGRFYRNRALRLFPPLLLALAGYAVVEGLLDHTGERGLVAQTLVAALTYTMNVPGIPHGSESLYHYWTLATEEQFYLVWPLALALAWRRRRLRPAVAVAVLVALAACAATMVAVSPDTARIYALPTSWASALLIGCAGYLGRDALHRRLPTRRPVRRAVVLGLLLALAAGSLAQDTIHQPWLYLVVVPAAACGSMVLISSASGWHRLPTRLLRPAVLLGTISYAAYLWNGAIVRWLGDPETLGGALLGVLLTLAAATASWWLVERPAARLRARLDARDRG